MEQQHIKLHYHSIWPAKVIIICKGMPDEHKIISSQEEMNQLLEEVKLYNFEKDKEQQKRIISI